MEARRSVIAEVLALEGGSVGLSSLAEVSHLLQRALEQQLQPFDLSSAAQRLLFHVYFASQPPTPTALAHLLLQETQSISGLLTRLEAQGFVVRTPHPLDRRSVQVELTDRGQQVARLAVQALLDLAAELNQELGAAESCAGAFEHLKQAALSAAAISLSQHQGALDDFWR